MLELIMKKLLLISGLFCASATIQAQNIHCMSVAQNNVTLYAKNALSNVNTKKTIRVIIHFPLKSNGTENFTETKDCNGNVSSDYNGYWFAEKFIERANDCLQHNEKMKQQLSNRDIKVKPINIQFELAGVVFHRNDNLFCPIVGDNTLAAYTTMLNQCENLVGQTNKEEAIHVFLYKGLVGYGISQGSVCVVSGVDTVYNDFIHYDNGDNTNNWYFDGKIVRLSLHEIGHCLTLEHPKLYGDTVEVRKLNYDDDCADTPTYRELLSDGYKDPYEWNGEKSSNNVMDYNASQSAWTPCQIEKVHKNIAQRKYLYPNLFKTNTSTVTGYINQGNKVVIAKNVTAKNVTVPKDRALYINCDEFQTSGEFEVKLGARFEIK